MSREEECDLLQSMIRDELEILRCDSQDSTRIFC